jgi:cyanate permease
MNEAYQEPDRNLENDASVELSKRTSEVAQKRNVWKNRFSLFQNTSFWLFCLGIFLANFGYNTDVLYLPTIGVQMGNSLTQSSLLVSILREYHLGIMIVFIMLSS